MCLTFEFEFDLYINVNFNCACLKGFWKAKSSGAELISLFILKEPMKCKLEISVLLK